MFVKEEFYESVIWMTPVPRKDFFKIFEKSIEGKFPVDIEMFSYFNIYSILKSWTTLYCAIRIKKFSLSPNKYNIL